MKISKQRLKEIIKEELLKERKYTELEAIETSIFDMIIEFKKAFEKSPHKKNRKINMLIKQMLKLEAQLGDMVSDLE